MIFFLEGALLYNIVMDTIRLRTLTKKSQLLFGKFKDCKVGDLINAKEKRLLTWYYFNCDMISFREDVLDELNITEEYRIEKPGKNPELFEQFINELFEKRNKLYNYVAHRKHIKKTKAKNSQSRMREGRRYSKDNLRSKNQGH